MKRIVSVILSLLLIAACMPFTVSAAAAWGDLKAVDGSTVSATPEAPCEMNVIIFGRTTCGNTQSTLRSISGSDLPNSDKYRFIYADIDGAGKDEVAEFAKNYSDKITFCYGDNNAMMWEMLNSYGSVSLPVIHYIGTDGGVKKSTTGAQSANTIKAALGLTDPSIPQYVDAYVHGSYYVNIQEALDRINEIRYEACSEGIENPSKPGKALTLSDYHPLVWSADLEQTARQRAAEAYVTLDHTRPNGLSCFTIDGSVKSGSEVLAWNYSKSMVPGLNQFYEEKSNWVNKTGGVTGHYTSMINPNFYSVGLGLFYSTEGPYSSYPSSLCGRFSTQKSGLDQTFGEAIADATVKIEVDTSLITDVGLYTTEKVPDPFNVGDKLTVALVIVTEFDGYTGYLTLKDGVTWRSSDTNVLRVKDGVVTAVGGGKASVSASIEGGFSAEATLEISGEPYQGAMLGDVDGDGELTVNDATFIQRVLADIEIPFELDEDVADMDGNGKVELIDATLIMYNLIRFK